MRSIGEVTKDNQEIQPLILSVVEAFLSDALSKAFVGAVQKLRKHLTTKQPIAQNAGASAQGANNDKIDIQLGKILLNQIVIYQDEYISLQTAAMEQGYDAADAGSNSDDKWNKFHDYVAPAIQQRIKDKKETLQGIIKSFSNGTVDIETQKSKIHHKIRKLKLIADFQILGKGRGYFSLLANWLNNIGISEALSPYANVYGAGIRDITLDMQDQLVLQEPDIRVLNVLLVRLKAYMRKFHISEQEIPARVVEALKVNNTLGEEKNLSIYQYAQQEVALAGFWESIQAMENGTDVQEKRASRQVTFSVNRYEDNKIPHSDNDDNGNDDNGNNNNDNDDNDGLDDAESFNSEHSQSEQRDDSASGQRGHLEHLYIIHSKPWFGSSEIRSKEQGQVIFVNLVIVMATLAIITATLADEAGFGTMAHGIFSEFSEEKAEKATSGMVGAVGLVALFAWNVWSYKSRSAASAVHPLVSS